MIFIRTLVLVTCFVIALPASAAPEDSVVGLYVKRGFGRADLGTGFFTNDSGQIMTAYHVVVGATSIQVVDANERMYSDIRVAFVSAKHDLAFLQIESPQGATPFLPLSEIVPPPQDSLTVIGYPRGLSQQHLAARTTSPSYVSSMELRSPDGARLFRERIDVIGIDATTYSGMSGAPVLSRGTVVGVFSGSFNEGGSIAWAIPVKYVSQVSRLGYAPGAISEWPPFTLMADSFRSLQRAFRVNETGERRLSTYVEGVGKLSAAANALSLSSTELQAAFTIMRPTLQGARLNPALTGNKDALMDYLEVPLEQMLEKMDAFGKANTAFSTAHHETATTLLDLMNWYEQEPSITSQERYSLDQRADRMRPMGANYYDYIGANNDNLTQAMTRLASGVALMGQGNANKGRELVDALIGVIAGFEPEVNKHASLQAMTKARQDVSHYFNIASLFETIVYRR